MHRQGRLDTDAQVAGRIGSTFAMTDQSSEAATNGAFSSAWRYCAAGFGVCSGLVLLHTREFVAPYTSSPTGFAIGTVLMLAVAVLILWFWPREPLLLVASARRSPVGALILLLLTVGPRVRGRLAPSAARLCGPHWIRRRRHASGDRSGRETVSVRAQPVRHLHGSMEGVADVRSWPLDALFDSDIAQSGRTAVDRDHANVRPGCVRAERDGGRVLASVPGSRAAARPGDRICPGHVAGSVPWPGAHPGVLAADDRVCRVPGNRPLVWRRPSRWDCSSRLAPRCWRLCRCSCSI